MDTNGVLSKYDAGQLIKRYRRSRGIGIRRFAAMVGLSTAGLTTLENGVYGASTSNLRRIVEALEIAPADVSALIDAYSARLREAVHEWDDLCDELVGRA